MGGKKESLHRCLQELLGISASKKSMQNADWWILNLLLTSLLFACVVLTITEMVESGVSIREACKNFSKLRHEQRQAAYFKVAMFLDCKQSLSGQLRGCAHSAARLERGEINEPSSARSLQFFRARLFRATSRLSRKGLLAVYDVLAVLPTGFAQV